MNYAAAILAALLLAWISWFNELPKATHQGSSGSAATCPSYLGTSK